MSNGGNTALHWATKKNKQNTCCDPVGENNATPTWLLTRVSRPTVVSVSLRKGEGCSGQVGFAPTMLAAYLSRVRAMNTLLNSVSRL